MKKEIPLPMIIVAVLAIVGIIGYFFVTKLNAPSEVTIPDSKMMKERMLGQQQSGRMPDAAPGKAAPSSGSGGGSMQQRMMQQYQSGGTMRQPPPGPR